MLAIGCRMLPLALQAAVVKPCSVELSGVVMPREGIDLPGLGKSPWERYGLAYLWPLASQSGPASTLSVAERNRSPRRGRMLQLAELSNRDVMKPGRDQEAKQS
jgi:hypothetical protein